MINMKQTSDDEWLKFCYLFITWIWRLCLYLSSTDKIVQLLINNHYTIYQGMYKNKVKNDRIFFLKFPLFYLVNE